MKVIRSEYPVPVDVDSTLVMHMKQPLAHKHEDAIRVRDSAEGGYIYVLPHKPNIRLLKEEKSRGAHIIVWSRGGFQWATDVIKALKLQKYVDIVMTKPLTYIDDVKVSDWMKYRVWLPFEADYKK